MGSGVTYHVTIVPQCITHDLAALIIVSIDLEL